MIVIVIKILESEDEVTMMVNGDSYNGGATDLEIKEADKITKAMEVIASEGLEEN